MIVEGAIQARYQAIAPVVDERVRRLVLAAEASAAGRGGQAAVARATGASRGTIRRGIRELGQPAVGAAKGRIRHRGGGRKRTVEHDPRREDLDRLVEPTSRGDPESPLRWTCKSVRQLAAGSAKGTKSAIAWSPNCSTTWGLQANRKTLAGTEHPDRNAQFEPWTGRCNCNSPCDLVAHWWGPSRTVGGSCVPRERRSKCWCMTS